MRTGRLHPFLFGAAVILLAAAGACLSAALHAGPARAVEAGQSVSSGVQVTCPGEEAREIVAAVRASGEIALQSGRTVRLVDLRLARLDELSDTDRRRLDFLTGAPVLVRTIGKPDRWGRVPASLRLDGRAPIDLAELLVGEGLAAVDPGEGDRLCRPDLLRLEAGARARRLALWRDADLQIAATERERLSKAAGSFAVVEGRVISVGERRERTYLNFGRDWARDFSATIPKRVWGALRAQGISAAGLTGRHLRVRGRIELRRAPSVDIAVAELVEILDKPAAQP